MPFFQPLNTYFFYVEASKLTALVGQRAEQGESPPNYTTVDKKACSQEFHNQLREGYSNQEAPFIFLCWDELIYCSSTLFITLLIDCTYTFACIKIYIKLHTQE